MFIQSIPGVAAQFHPQITTTYHNSSHQCKISSSTHTRMYNFTKNVLSMNGSGTYYCAVAMCGNIISEHENVQQGES